MRKKITRRKKTEKNYVDIMADAAKKAEDAKKDIAAINNHGNGKKPLAEAKKPAIKAKRAMPTSRALYMALCVTAGLLGVGCAVLYFRDPTSITWGLVMMPFLALAWWMFYLFKRQHEQATDLVYYGKAAPKVQVNAMNIYPVEKGGIIFENITDKNIDDLTSKGANPRVCVNDGKAYFVNIWNGKELVNFSLPDQQYYDPRVFGERVLELPAHRKLFQRKQSLLQKLSPFLLILVMAIEWILIITTTTPKGS